MAKKSKLLMIVCCLLCSLNVGTFTNNNTATISKNTDFVCQKEIITLDECEIAAENWLKDNYDDGTTVKDIVSIMQDEEISSYCVNFEKDNEPNGYIVVDTDKQAKNSIPEFCLSGKGIYDTLAEQSYDDVSIKEEDKVIYSLGPFDYAIPIDENAEKFYSSNGEELSKEVVLKTSKKAKTVESKDPDEYLVEASKQQYYEGFFTSDSIPRTGYTTKTITGASSFTPSVMSSFLPANGFDGNCGPTAATNLLSYYKEKRGFSNLGTSRQNIYNNFISASGFDEYGTSGLTPSAADSAIKTMFKNAGYSYSSSTYLFDWWSDWTRDLNDNYPVFTAVRGLKLNGGSWIEVGHAIIAVGYREYNSGAKYLRVYDGWNATNDKYIWFNSDYFKSIDGIVMKVTS